MRANRFRCLSLAWATIPGLSVPGSWNWDGALSAGGDHPEAYDPRGPVPLRRTGRDDAVSSPPLAPRQVSPQVSAARLSKFRTDLTPAQVEIVDAFKQQCPGFAVMRKLVLNFRSLLRMGKLAALRRWMKRAQKTGIHALTRFVRTLQQDLRAVEAAVTEPWSNGPVEGHINRLKTLKRQMYGRAGIELLRARLLPESRIAGQCVHQS